jgi:hypothetical protein
VVAIAFAPPAAISAALPGWHADRPADKLDEAVIPVLSLGATRRFLIKPDRGGRSTVITTHGGDLVVMGGRCITAATGRRREGPPIGWSRSSR